MERFVTKYIRFFQAVGTVLLTGMILLFGGMISDVIWMRYSLHEAAMQSTCSERGNVEKQTDCVFELGARDKLVINGDYQYQVLGKTQPSPESNDCGLTLKGAYSDLNGPSTIRLTMYNGTWDVDHAPSRGLTPGITCGGAQGRPTNRDDP